MTDTTTDETAKVDMTPAPREPGTGKFVKGFSGNPAGRVKGTKNKITLARLLLEAQLRETLEQEGPKLMRKAIKMAMGSKGKPGNDKIMRVLLDKMLATPKGEDDSGAKDNEITINVNNLSGPAPKPVIEGSSSPAGRTISVSLPPPKSPPK